MKKLLSGVLFVAGLTLTVISFSTTNVYAAGGGDSEWCDEDLECCKKGSCCAVIT